MSDQDSARDIAELIKIGDVLVFPKGGTITAEGNEVRDLFFIKSGSVEIRKKGGDADERLETLGPGEFFGEIISDPHTRAETMAVAVVPTLVIRISEDTMVRQAMDSPHLAWEIARSYSKRILALNESGDRQFRSRLHAWEEEISKLNRIIKAAQVVNSSLELRHVLQSILDETLQATEATRATIYLVDEITNEIVSNVMVGDELTEIRQPIGQGISGYVAQTGETVCIDDAYLDDRFNPEFDRISGFRTRSILCVAMRDKNNKVVGAFQLINKRNGNFTAEDETFLKAISIHASIAIENSQLVTQIVKSERLSAVGSMAETIIHDIKNPMTTIRLYAQVLKKHVTSKEGQDLVDEITEQIDRLVRIAQEVLDFSRDFPSLNVQRMEFDEFLSGILLFVGKDFEKRKIELVNESSYHGKIEADVDRLTRVILNIASNSADAMPSGGKFTIKSRSKDGSLILELVDTGLGIPEAVKKRIFEPFVTYGKKNGTGLGMAIVKRIVDEHKGEVKIISESGKGTRVVVRLPLVFQK